MVELGRMTAVVGMCAALLAIPAPGQTRSVANPAALSYPIVDTGQVRCFDDRSEIEYPRTGRDYFGQDAQYSGNSPRYRDTGSASRLARSPLARLLYHP